MSNDNSSVLSSICSSDLINPVYPNSSVSEVVTPCLSEVLFPAVPTALALLCPLFIWITACGNANPSLAITTLVAAKFVVPIVNVTLSAVQCIMVFWVWGAAYGEVSSNTVLSLLFTFMSIFSYAQCVRLGVLSSGILHFIWFLRLLSLVPQTVLAVVALSGQEEVSDVFFGHTLLWVAFVGHVLCAVLMVILLCVADKHSVEYETIGMVKEVNPESWCSSVSKATFWYANRVIGKGLKASKGLGTLTVDDIWAMDKLNRSDYLRDVFQRYAAQHRFKLTVPKLFFTLLRCCWRPVAGATSLAVIMACLRFTDTLMLRAIINSLSRRDPVWFCMLSAIALFGISFTRKVITTRRDYHALTAYFTVRIVLINALFDKVIKLSAAAQSRTSAGQILNMVTTDVARIRLFWYQLKDFVFCPFMIIVAIGGLVSVCHKCSTHDTTNQRDGVGCVGGAAGITTNSPYYRSVGGLTGSIPAAAQPFSRPYDMVAASGSLAGRTEQCTSTLLHSSSIGSVLVLRRPRTLSEWSDRMEGLWTSHGRAVSGRTHGLNPRRGATFFTALRHVIGLNAFYGVGVLVVFIPCNFYMARVQSRYEQGQMKYKSERLKLMNDILSGIRVLKLYAWEPSMRKMVAALRTKELQQLRIAFILEAITDASFYMAPVLATSVSFLGYTVIQGHQLTPEVAFVALMFFMMLRFSIYQLPQIFANAIKAIVSCDRIAKFLNEEELQPTHIRRGQHLNLYTHVVSLDECTFSWDSCRSENPTPHLWDISLQVSKGQLIGVVGKVGSGKSSLLSALLGEMELIKGDYEVFTQNIGYVPQQAWIQNRTLRENVTFDSVYNDAHYHRTIAACALTEDLALLAAGDMTEIGEKGINLSGGQKARVALARAVYRRADLYLLDDVLAAVDSHVGNHIYDKVIGPSGMLKKTTRIFALNTMSFLKDCDRIVVMHEGHIFEMGTLRELSQKTEGPFADLMRDYVRKQRSRRQTLDEEPGSEATSEAGDVLKELVGSPLSESLKRVSEDDPASSSQQLSQSYRRQTSYNRQISQLSLISESNVSSVVNHVPHSPAQTIHENADAGRLIDEEEMAIGTVSKEVYIQYFKAFGVLIFAAYMFMMFGASTFLDAYSSIWLAKWSSEATATNGTVPKHTNNTFYLTVYSLLGIGNTVFKALSGVFLSLGAYKASTWFHDSLVHSLLHSPMSFFDRTPLGRIINRLSSDMDRIDENVPGCVAITFILLSEALQNLVAIVIVIPALFIVVLPMMVAFVFIARIYNMCSVQYRRLTSKAWSTTCSFIQDAYIGSASIRAFNVVEGFREKICKCTDTNIETDLVEMIANRWIQVRLDLMTDIAVFCCLTVAIILGHDDVITLGVVGLVVNSGVMFSGYLGEVARVWRECEVQVVCVERISEYIGNEPEASWRIEGPEAPPSSWPADGVVIFKDYSLRYREGSDLVLKSINFSVAAGEKVGIVGRTGAGKTSLTLALFRIVEPATGTIYIDGVDTTKVGLHDLRQALTIIPQDPVLFCGTLRSNLDPFNEYTDDEIWTALAKAHLTDMVSGFENKLDHEVAEGGNNLSVGQRQLVCLARALLRTRTKILVLDEATAAIDVETDRLIQLSIAENFKNSTILTIAHRLNTIRHYDKVLVLDAGEVREYDSPDKLLSDPNSMFSSLARHAGLQENES